MRTTISANEQSLPSPRCRVCDQALRHGFVDLGMSPPCESYRTV
ncbi:MAG: hypothetical protein GX616_09080, partial [Planctomycetes bacterium]|nr:hypothetical protein [Planctomycetota bacterium]